MNLCAFFFYSIMSDSLRFAEDHSNSNQIDKSHNHHHSLEVLYWSSDIMRRSQKKYTLDELKIISESCLLHDMVDHKYGLNTENVEDYLFQKHDKETAETIMNIIGSISYSKTFLNGRVVFPQWIENSRYRDAYHIVREADLLSSYNIARMIEYRLAQEMPVASIKKEVVEFYNERVSNLVRRKFFVHPFAASRARQLNEIAKLKIGCIDHYDIEDNNLDFYRIVDFINLQKIASFYGSIIEDCR